MRKVLQSGIFGFSFFMVLFFFMSHFAYAQNQSSNQVDVKIVTDEADAVLSIRQKLVKGEEVIEADWKQLFESEGYIRLKKREAAIKHPFTDAEFKTFILSDSSANKRDALQKTLREWKSTDINETAKKSLAYLPSGAKIKAKIYPVIKIKTNSFVFETDIDPAIFLYIDPLKPREEFENTLAHELHHIGYSASCKSERDAAEAAQTGNAKTVYYWIGAFGEGFAMLAAAGGPDIHPHLYSKMEDRERWDHDVSNFNEEQQKVVDFFSGILENRYDENKTNEIGSSFFGIQGPWYTVGWKMAMVIEKIYGRSVLIECICDQRKLLPTYNKAVKEYNKQNQESNNQWPDSIINAVNN